MVFSSAIFLWAFLPAVFVLNALIRPRYSNLLLLLASLVFYAWGEPLRVFIMLGVTLVSWLTGVALLRCRSRWRLVLGILCVLSVLVYYKYVGFLISTVNLALGGARFSAPNITLPIGISFFTFQAISFMIDVYRGDVVGRPTFVDTALYISFFPQLIAGPIVKYKDISRQIKERTITMDGVAAGFRRFLYGLAKKTLIANVLGLCADTIYGYDIGSITGALAWMASLAYTFQIYYDFSGYSDMAIGLGKMFGFNILENFNYPYLSTDIGEFWRRWHISLGAWFREYVYIPLGGNRKGKARTYFNLIVVFFLTGLWHGASFSFILWGLYHGFFSILERLGFKKALKKTHLGGIYCFLVVHLGWVLFRVDGIANAARIIKRLLMPWRYMGNGVVLGRIADSKLIFVTACAAIGCGLLQKICPASIQKKWKGSVAEFLYCAILLILCMASIATNTYNPFIYFQF